MVSPELPGLKLDVADRMRVRQGNSPSAGIWFYQKAPDDHDRGFVGMADDNHVGFWGNTGAGWGLVMDTGSGNVGIGTSEPQATLHVNGDIMASGDIVLQNADCAEEFDIASVEEAEPGTVMVLDESGHLRPSSEPYDKKVAGVVSGGGDLKPGLILDNQPGKNNRLPIALLGKTCCKVDTRYSPIEVGDLLTTSSTPGHAMKATDPVRAFGSIIGKALHSLNSGTGMIPILIALQ